MMGFLLYFSAGQTTSGMLWADPGATLWNGHTQIECYRGYLTKIVKEQLQEPVMFTLQEYRILDLGFESE